MSWHLTHSKNFILHEILCLNTILYNAMWWDLRTINIYIKVRSKTCHPFIISPQLVSTLCDDLIPALFGSFGLLTKEPYTVMLCLLCIIVLHRHWCQCWCWHWHLCTPPPGTGLDVETSYLVHICAYVPHICTSNI